MEDIKFLNFTYMNQQINAEIQQAFTRVWDSQWYILGKEVSAFETAYAAFSGINHCVGVANGLDALILSLKVLGIGPGNEVIVPSNTYIATVLAVSYVGAKPVFVEPDLNTYNINAVLIEEKITPKTRAIIPVHLYGQSCDMTAIMAIANKHGVYVVEDNAQSQGATWDGKMTGTFGHLNATSFYPGKNLGALGDAGAITTFNDALAQKVCVLRNYGSEKKYYNEVKGVNSRLDELQAAFLSVKLKYLGAWNAERRQVAKWYNQYLGNTNALILPIEAAGANSVYHLYVIRTKQRDALQQHLQMHGIGTLIHYPIPPHLQQAYVELGYKQGDFPLAEEIAGTCLSLPIYPGLVEPEVAYIASCIHSFFAAHGGKL